MWPFNSKEAEDIKRPQHFALDDKTLDCIKERLDHQTMKLIDLKKTALEASICIDFEKMNVVSIERQIEQSHECLVTTIGYIINDKVKEWYLYISDEKHEELVYKFREFLRMKYNLKTTSH